MSFEDITSTEADDVYLVKSQRSNERYAITISSQTCSNVQCNLKCSHCRVCTHIMSCSCPDSLMRTLTCKHVHLLQRYFVQQGILDHSVKDNEGHEHRQQQIDITLENVKNPSRCRGDLDVLKSSIKTQLLELMSKVL